MDQRSKMQTSLLIEDNKYDDKVESAWKEKPIKQWTVNDVSEWLSSEDVALNTLAEKFKQHEIRGLALIQLTEKQLKEKPFECKIGEIMHFIAVRKEHLHGKTGKNSGLNTLLALLFNCACWIVLIFVTFPWNIIYLCICCRYGEDVEEGKEKKEKEMLLNKREQKDPFLKCYSHPCKQCIELYKAQYEVWYGMGLIINTIIAWIAVYAFFGKDVEQTVTIAWQVGIFTYAVIFGALLIYEGVLEQVTGDEGRKRFEKQLIDDLEYEKKAKINTRGILFHYVVISFIIAITAGYIAEQAVNVMTEKHEVTFDNIYAWFSIVLSNIVIGYQFVKPVAKFMFEFYPHLENP